MANPEVFKKYGDGQTVDLPVGFGEAFTAIHEEVFVSIWIALFEDIETLITNMNATRAASQLSDFAAFKAAMAANTTTQTQLLTLEKGLRN